MNEPVESTGAPQEGTESTPETKKPTVRYSMAELPMYCTLTTPFEELLIFDVVTEQWVSREAYEKLLKADQILDGMDDLDGPRNKGDAIIQHSLMLEEAMAPKPAKRPAPEPPADESPEKKAKREKRKRYQERKKLKRMANVWTSSKSVSQVYVSGLPADVEIKELADLFTRYAGMIQEKPDGSPDIRLYLTEDNRIKGDCTINFVSKESVPQAIKLLDDYPIRDNCNIAVQKAEFEQKSSKQHSTEELKALAESRATMASVKEDFRRNRKLANQRKLAWDSSSLAHGKHRRIVIVELPAFPSTQSFISKIHPVVERLGGPLSKITILEGNRVALKFKEIVAAQRCLETMDNSICSTTFPEVFPEVNQTMTAFFFSGESFTPVELKEEESEAEDSEELLDEAETERMENYQKWLDEVSSDSDMEIKCESGSE